MKTNTAAPRTLYSSKRQRMIAGVCGGFAEYFAVDVTLVRILWLISLLFTRFGLIAYIVCAILMKNNPSIEDIPVTKSDVKTDQKTTAEKSTTTTFWVVLLVLLVILMGGNLFHQPFNISWPFQMWHWHHAGFDDFLSFIIVLVGVGYVATRFLRRNETESNANRPCRSKSKRMIAGVCGGLADFWHLDPTLIRIAFVALSLVTTIVGGMVVYLILLIAIPEEH